MDAMDADVKRLQRHGGGTADRKLMPVPQAQQLRSGSGHGRCRAPKVDDMTYEHTPLHRWDPAPLAEVADLFCDLTAPWWVAGGIAIELAAGHRIRDHSDIDIPLLRRDQRAAQQALPDWQWWAADPP